jgi:hypothetical protein
VKQRSRSPYPRGFSIRSSVIRDVRSVGHSLRMSARVALDWGWIVSGHRSKDVQSEEGGQRGVILSLLIVSVASFSRGIIELMTSHSVRVGHRILGCIRSASKVHHRLYLEDDVFAPAHRSHNHGRHAGVYARVSSMAYRQRADCRGKTRPGLSWRRGSVQSSGRRPKGEEASSYRQCDLCNMPAW